jgi:hypothetical protein
LLFGRLDDGNTGRFDLQNLVAGCKCGGRPCASGDPAAVKPSLVSTVRLSGSWFLTTLTNRDSHETGGSTAKDAIRSSLVAAPARLELSAIDTPQKTGQGFAFDPRSNDVNLGSAAQ